MLHGDFACFLCSQHKKSGSPFLFSPLMHSVSCIKISPRRAALTVGSFTDSDGRQGDGEGAGRPCERDHLQAALGPLPEEPPPLGEAQGGGPCPAPPSHALQKQLLAFGKSVAELGTFGIF